MTSSWFNLAFCASTFFDDDREKVVRSSGDGFQRSYFSLELTRNDPVGSSIERFESGNRFMSLTYMHVLGQSYLMSIGATFKSFRRKDLQREIALMSLVHTASLIFRLYEPTYILPGVRILYLLPALGAQIPPEADKDFTAEIGGALSLTVLHHISPKLFLSLRLERWRGTATAKFHGVETALGIGFSLD